jgi:X-X-X-Leu-X-X-Gly heptad repeat protein
MKTSAFRFATLVCLAAALTVLPFPLSPVSADASTPLATASRSPARATDKREVVYANLAPGGVPLAVYVVNHFEVAQAGNLVDHGLYASVVNLTDTDPLTQSGDEVTFQAAAGDYFYQGNLATAELPWIFEITYLLDGTRTAAQDLRGRSGELEIRLTTRANPKADPVFFENYLLQIELMLDTARCDGIAADGATIAEAGNDRVVAFTVLPGKDADLSVTATVRDFALAGIGIRAMPFSMALELPDTSGMTKDLTALTDAIAKLDGGVKTLAEGVSGLDTGAFGLAGGSASFAEGLSQLAGRSAPLESASAQIGQALSGISAALGATDWESDLTQIAQLPPALSQLALGLDEIRDGILGLSTGYSDAYAALDAAMAALPGTEIAMVDIEGLYATVTEPGQRLVLDQLVESYRAALVLKATYSQVQSAFAAVDANLGAMSESIGTISGTLSGISTRMSTSFGGEDPAGRMQALSTGLSTLASQYGQFDAGLNQYLDGARTLSTNYGALDQGIASLSGGLAGLDEGTQTLSTGTGELNAGVAGLPDRIQTEIDSLVSAYDGSDFQPVSFVSSANQNVSLVQFVFATAEIEPLEKTPAVEPVVAKVTFWDRLVALFTRTAG